MEFDELLDRFWMYDSEVFAHDTLIVFIKYRTHERKIFHNTTPNDLQTFFDKEKPILVGYNNKGYDQYILKATLFGCTQEEIKGINDHIISGGNGWDIDLGYNNIPTQIDLIYCIVPRKSLKELEGNLRLNITETTVPFDLPDKWNEKQYEEVLYYCTCDVQALFPIFERLMTRFKSKYIIAKLGDINPEYALSLTDANLTATLLGGQKKEHTDNFKYTYPKNIDKNKIPKVVLDYFDDLIEHNDLDYNPPAPSVRFGESVFQVGIGGGHAARETTFVYDNGSDLKCE